MKRWLKLNYIYYVGLLVVLLMSAIAGVFQYNEFTYAGKIFSRGDFQGDKLEYILSHAIQPQRQFFEMYGGAFIIVLLVFHGIMLWGQRDKSERELLETMPIRKQVVAATRFILDIGIVAVVAVVAGIVTYVRIDANIRRFGVEISWLSDCISGIVIMFLGFMILVIGVMHFVEALVVRGDVKVIATGAVLFMWYTVTYCLTQGILEDDNSFNRLIGFWFCSYDNLEWFSRWGHFVGQFFAYLSVGVILSGLAVYFTKKQNLSKKGFYFVLGNLIVSIVAALTVLMLIFERYYVRWYGAVLLGGIVFVACMRLTREEKW